MSARIDQVIIKGCRIKRRAEQDANVWVRSDVYFILSLWCTLWCLFYFELTLSACWRWSCNSLHGSKCWCKWTCGYL